MQRYYNEVGKSKDEHAEIINDILKRKSQKNRLNKYSEIERDSEKSDDERSKEEKELHELK